MERSTWISPVPLLAFLSRSGIPPISSVSPWLTGIAMIPRRAWDARMTSAQTGRDLVVLQLAGKTDL